MTTFIVWMLFEFIDLNHHFKSILHAQITSSTIVNAREKNPDCTDCTAQCNMFHMNSFLISFLSSFFFQVYAVLFIFISRFLLNFLFIHSSDWIEYLKSKQTTNNENRQIKWIQITLSIHNRLNDDIICSKALCASLLLFLLFTVVIFILFKNKIKF